MNYGKNYIDRGIVKWTGMYLAEHTAQLEAFQKKEHTLVTQKKQMSSLEIDEIVACAVLKNVAVCIQKEARDLNGHYYPDVIGKIRGYDNRGLFINDEKVDFDEIRHISIQPSIKWFE